MNGGKACSLLFAAMLITVISGPDFLVASDDRVVLYDLRYALSFDPDRTPQINKTWDHCHIASTLQGIVNREKPRLYLRFVDSPHSDTNVDDYWLKKERQPGQWLEHADIHRRLRLLALSSIPFSCLAQTNRPAVWLTLFPNRPALG